MSRIHLSVPEVTENDRSAVQRALEGGWLAPVGPEIDAFEEEIAETTARAHAAALTSGTAALHLALLILGVGGGDRVLVSDLTFSATVNAIRYVGAEPVFIDSTLEDWNMDPSLLEVALEDGRYAACVPVDIYGQCADYHSIVGLCDSAGIPIITDAAESLGASYDGKPAGSFGVMSALSFNGNKIITTSGGGALVSDDAHFAERARFLSTQARDPAPHYQHSEVGYNYRLSNLLAALGRSQLFDLPRRIETRRSHNAKYRAGLGDLPGVEFMPEGPKRRSTFWLTALTIDPDQSGVTREEIRLALERENIEARPVWKPMHLQPVFEEYQSYGGGVSESLFRNGLCLPSGSSLSAEDRARVIRTVRSVFATV